MDFAKIKEEFEKQVDECQAAFVTADAAQQIASIEFMRVLNRLKELSEDDSIDADDFQELEEYVDEVVDFNQHGIREGYQFMEFWLSSDHCL